MEIIQLLRESQAMLEGHFLLSSGKHSDKYFQCAKLFQYPDKAKAAVEGLANQIREDIKSGKLKVDVIAGPALGGILPAWELARQLNLPAIFTERDENGVMSLRRGFEIQSGTNVLIVEDVVTTGKSSKECAQTLITSGAVITALACIVDRRGKGELTANASSAEIPWPIYPATVQNVASWEADVCELCKQGVPLVKPGSRKVT